MEKHNLVNLILDVVGIVLLYLVFNYTSPTDSGSLGVFLVFVLIYLVIFGVLALIWGMYKQFALNKKTTLNDYVETAVLAFLPVILLVLRSAGALNIVSGIVAVAVVSVLLILVPKLK